MSKEIFADNGYLLGINSILFAVLVDHVKEDKCEISLKDFENKQKAFINCGKLCYFNFKEEELINFLDKKAQPYIQSIDYNKWLVNMKGIIGNYVNSLDKEGLRYYFYNEFFARIDYLFYWLDIDYRIFDSSNEGVICLLKCNWRFNLEETDKHNDYLFDVAKAIKPDGNNTEWLRLMKILHQIELEEKIDENEDDLTKAYTKTCIK